MPAISSCAFIHDAPTKPSSFLDAFLPISSPHSLAFPQTNTMCASPGTADTAADALRHVPRAYQEEIFAQARSANVIAALDTGTGKTLIAAMLVKWAAAQSPPPSDPIDGRRQPLGKKIIFLVPKVPLVDQQREFLANQTPLEVRGYAGSMGTDGWDRGRWMEEFREADVLVMTGAHILSSLKGASLAAE